MSSMEFGKKLVGATFNPSGDPVVNELKSLYAQIIDICARPIGDLTETKRDLFKKAIEHAITAQMWAVKAQTWKD